MQVVANIARRVGPPERAFAAVAAVLALVSGAFWVTSASMVSVWNSSGTYSHGYIIVPAFLWLVWRRRNELATLPLRSNWWALPAVATIGAAWLAGQWMVLSLPSQLALVAMVPAVIAGTLGVAWVQALQFPLAFLFFAVPFGESLVPVLMDWTADFTVAALKLSGVPVYRDGLHFDIPSGRWSVVDSCSGIRYVFACLAVSSLYAWTIYRGTFRRLAFLGLALVTAVVANWVRAFVIVMLGHLSNNRIATGADHLVYGALLFGVIMALIFALGAMWREDAPLTGTVGADARGAPAHVPQKASSHATPQAAAVIATLVTMLVWPAVSIGSATQAEEASISVAAIRPVGRWVKLEQPLASWRPLLKNPAAVVSGSFAKSDNAVGIHIGMFGRSTTESKLTTAMNRFLEPDGLNPQWKLVRQNQAQARWNGHSISVRTGVIVGSEARLLAWQWYWVDGSVTADPFRASVLQLLARLRGRSEISAWITVYARDIDESTSASRVLQEFLDDASSSIDSALSRSPLKSMASGTQP